MNALTFTRNVVRVATVSVMAGSVIIATGFGFAQSYSGLYRWGLAHQLSGWKAESFPLLVDVFIIVGELGMFLLALDSHKLKKAVLPWIDLLIPAAVASCGWLVSLWFNVGHVKGHNFDDKVTAGVPPVTAMVGLVILLRTIHRYMSKIDDEKAESQTATVVRVPEPAPEAPAALPEAPAAPAEIDAPAQAPAALPQVPAEAQSAVVRVFPTVPDWSPNGTATSDDVPEYIRKQMRHEKWNEAVSIYRESLSTPGKSHSQRTLAERLGMKNRMVAKAAIDYVNNHGEEV